jgi:hypothetical protein
MAITINGTGSITGLTAGGLPDGSVTAADIETSLDLTGKTVTLPSGTGGKILQVQQAYKTDRYSLTATTTWLDIPSLSVTITPVAADSNFLILPHVVYGQSTIGDICAIQIVRGTTAVGNGTSATGSRINVFMGGDSVQNPSRTTHASGSFVDDPTYTLGDSITYKLQIRNWSGTATVNFPQGDENDQYIYCGTSALTILEVSA